ncbi:MAG: hypothetical protein AAFN78_01545 [Pseudomonadota bacterium]
MPRTPLLLALCLSTATAVHAQTMTLSTSDADFQITNVFSDVDVFNFNIEINAPLAAGVYTDPEIISVTYQVQGVLTAGTPSGFPAFDLQRTMDGDEFYAQGSSLSFEIDAAAVLDDGVQVAELVGNAVVLTFNGREIDNGRFHPALFELNADGTGRLQNSNNIPTQSPLLEVAFGEEYITDLQFDPGNTTLITGNDPDPPAPAPAPAPTPSPGGGGGGAQNLAELFLLALLLVVSGGRRSFRANRA